VQPLVPLAVGAADLEALERGDRVERGLRVGRQAAPDRHRPRALREPAPGRAGVAVDRPDVVVAGDEQHLRVPVDPVRLAQRAPDGLGRRHGRGVRGEQPRQPGVEIGPGGGGHDSPSVPAMNRTSS
jgi:hypothetical protein